MWERGRKGEQKFSKISRFALSKRASNSPIYMGADGRTQSAQKGDGRHRTDEWENGRAGESREAGRKGRAGCGTAKLCAIGACLTEFTAARKWSHDGREEAT